jgi:hypothetical protein
MTPLSGALFMLRPFACLTVLFLLPLFSGCAASRPAASAEDPGEAASEPASGPSVKVSLSMDDADLHTIQSKSEVVEFFIFLDGQVVRGFEFGMTIEGGELMGYVVDTTKPWATLPLGGYPGTMIQAAAGDNCFEPPAYAGKLLVKPHKPGGPVVVDVMPSSQNEIATLLNCDMSADYVFRAYPAAVNTKPPKDHEVRGIADESVSYPDTVPESTVPSHIKKDKNSAGSN